MNILILNAILYTAEKGNIPKIRTIKDTMIYNMCLGFLHLGHNVTLIAAKDYMPEEIETYDFEVLFFRTSCKKFFHPSVLPYLPKLSSYLRHNKNKFDIIISSEAFSLLTLQTACICPQKVLIWQELNLHQRKFHQIPSKIWYSIIIPLFYRKIRISVGRSISARNFIQKYMPATSNIVVEHGIPITKFTFSLQKKRMLISSSRLVPGKNIDRIILNFYKLHKIKGYEDISLIIANRGEKEQELRSLVHKLSISDFVQFVGFLSQEKLNEYTRYSLCFLMDTQRDLNVVSIPEAIVSGTPILSNSLPASADYIKKNNLGIIKDNWGCNELKQIIDNNSFYVTNCITYREKLANDYAAQTLITLFENAK